MLYYHYNLFAIMIVLAITSLILLNHKLKNKKVTLIINLITICINILMIIIINIDFINLISKEYSSNSETLSTYFKIIFDFNITFFITSLIVTIILFILSKKVKYNLIYILTIIFLVLGSILLFCFKGFILTKNVVNFAMLSQCLSFYYMYLCIIPLLIVSRVKSIRQC